MSGAASEIVDERRVIVAPLIVIGFNSDGQLIASIPPNIPGEKALLILEKIKFNMIAQAEIVGTPRRIVTASGVPALNGRS